MGKLLTENFAPPLRCQIGVITWQKKTFLDVILAGLLRLALDHTDAAVLLTCHPHQAPVQLTYKKTKSGELYKHTCDDVWYTDYRSEFTTYKDSTDHIGIWVSP